MLKLTYHIINHGEFTREQDERLLFELLPPLRTMQHYFRMQYRQVVV
jgi:hypothetical protein